MEKFIQAILSLLGSLLGSLATIAPKVETSAPKGPAGEAGPTIGAQLAR